MLRSKHLASSEDESSFRTLERAFEQKYLL